jgi:multicomponent Na+:H+ antiporter subunit B
MIHVLDVALLTLLVIVALAVVKMRDLFAIVMLFGVYSLVSACFFVLLDAPDVAMTEAAVGAGISTILMIATLCLVGRKEEAPTRPTWIPLLVCVVTGAVLVYGMSDLPRFGDPNAVIHQHVAPHYLAQAPIETGIPNVVTAVLASYRGFDTFGETTVVFTAGIGVLALLTGLRRKTAMPLPPRADEGARSRA